MKRKVSLILLLVFVLSLVVFALASCGVVNKQVPVYQGMSISTAKSTKFAPTSFDGGILLDSDNGDNGNHKGHYKGDSADRNENIDDENPYPDNNANENIEEEIKSSLNVIGSPDTIYYATPNQDIYINIHIDNPDSFEIMSFTLNGKKYSSYMFEAGSDMETIILKFNVGDAAGVVEYTIDAIKYIDGTEIKDVLINGNKTVKAGIRVPDQVVTNVSGVDVGTDSLSFDVSIQDRNDLIAISGGVLKAILYDGDNILAEKDLSLGNNSIKFDNLKSNTIYQYAVIGYFDDLSGAGFQMNVLHKEAFYTETTVLFDNIKVGQEHISFELLWHEDHQSKTLSALKLFRGDALVEDLDTNTTQIIDLLSDTTYTLVAEYDNGNKADSISIEFTTAAKTIPSFVLADENITSSAITADYAILDPDNVLSYYKIELYKNGTLLSESTDNKIDFDGLDYYVDYIVKFTFKYDLNDGYGEQTATYDYSFRTLPYIDIIECSVANTSAVFDGETIFMSMKLNNPIGMIIDSVVINGKTYNVTGASTKNKVFVEIVNNGQFAGGNTVLKVEKVNAKIANVAVTTVPESEVSDNVFINGKLEVLSCEVVDESFNPVEWAFPSEKLYVLIKLNNPTGYLVDNLNENSVTRIDDNTWYYPLDFKTVGYKETGMLSVKLKNITYYNEFLEKKEQCDVFDHFYLLASDEVKYISTPEDLLDMDDDYYYELKNDIDLSGLEWIGEAFYGVFNGNGYAIKNMACVKSMKYSDYLPGLFYTGSGVIYDLDIEDATIIVDVIDVLEEDLSSYKYFSFGFLVSRGGSLIIDGCTVDEYSVISVTPAIESTPHEHQIYVGGFVGSIDGAIIKITDSTNNGTVIGYSYTGGFAGFMNSGSIAVISNCTNNAPVNGKTFVGGIVGYCGGITITNSANNGAVSGIECVGGMVGQVYQDTIISDSINNASVSGDRLLGGLVGYVAFGDLSISNSINNGDVISTSDTPYYSEEYIGGLVGLSDAPRITNSLNTGVVFGNVSGGLAGHCGYEGIYTNSYSILTGSDGDNGIICTETEFNSKEFYTETLGFSEEIWDFSELDVENGKYPKLKH